MNNLGYDDRFIIYGCGKNGRSYYDFLCKHHLEKYILGFCDKNANTIKEYKGMPVWSYEEAKFQKHPFIVSVSIRYGGLEIENNLINDGCICYHDLRCIASIENIEWTKWEKELIAFIHEGEFEYYYDDAEKSVDEFWGATSPFYERFKLLDLSNVLELACGHGRHVPFYQEKAGHITLVDISQSNIDFCRNRFKTCNHIDYYCNNGSDLRKLSDMSFSTIFSYDAMVHFELMDIYSYLREFYRILIPQGRVLVHHSNNSKDYKASFTNSPGGRNFMSKALFAHLAYRSGFNILDQKVIDWTEPDWDCITLLEKE